MVFGGVCMVRNKNEGGFGGVVVVTIRFGVGITGDWVGGGDGGVVGVLVM